MLGKALVSFDADGNVADLNIIAETDEDVEIIRLAIESMTRRTVMGRFRRLLVGLKIRIQNEPSKKQPRYKSRSKKKWYWGRVHEIDNT